MVMLWLILLIGGLAAIIAALIFLSMPLAIAVGVAVVGVWFCAGMSCHWYCGIRRHVVRHLGSSQFHKSQVVTHVIPTTERANVQTALDHLHRAEKNPPPVFGLPISRHGGDNRLWGLVRDNRYPESLEWESFPRALNQQMNCAANALYLLTVQGEPYCAFVRPRTGRSRKQMELEVLAMDRDTAERSLARVLETARERSVYRGAILCLEEPEDRREGFSIRFHDMPPVGRESIVLPPEVMQVIDRNVLALLAHAEVLRGAGRSTRHGVLLYGPPGTGKTLVTKYLAHACTRYTVILLTGRQQKLVRESCQLARLLAPSMIVLEDVDLVATDRRRNRDNVLLHELMDEMDGLGARTDCIFLLTTNRPEVIEGALAARPGRVDQAIYFPLPDLECRRRLFAHFGKGLDLAGVEQESLLERTEGASPAFLEELFRKAALMAAERGERAQPLRVTSEDFEKALRELVEFGGSLTRNLLGYRGKQA